MTLRMPARPVMITFSSVWLLLLAIGCPSSSAHALTMYTYSGNDFTTVTPPYTTSDRVTGDFTLVSPLAANMLLTNITSQMSTVSFTDGVNSIENIGDNIVRVEVATDGSGHIDQWLVALESPSRVVEGVVGLIDTFNRSGDIVDVGNVDTCVQVIAGACTVFANVALGSILSNPGVWSSSVPEPSSWFLLGAGLAGLGYFSRRRAL
jgi:hypothetical protein